MTKRITIVVIGSLRVKETIMPVQLILLGCFLSDSWFYDICMCLYMSLREWDTLGSLFCHFYKGDNFLDFLFAFLDIKRLLKRGLL